MNPFLLPVLSEIFYCVWNLTNAELDKYTEITVDIFDLLGIEF
jgi:hypothetical protein